MLPKYQLGFQLDFLQKEKRKTKTIEINFTFYNRHLESTEFRLKILLCTTRGLQHAQATF